MLQRADFPTIWLFLYLQVLDVLTTLVGFSIGAGEGSPFVRLLVAWGPVAGLAASKLGAVALAAVCLWMRKPFLLRWINYWYAGLVVWNILVSLHLLTAGLAIGGGGTTVPSPKLTAAEVVSLQVDGLQHYNQPWPNAGIWTAYQFASRANRQVTGPYGRFLQIIRSPSNRSLLHSREWRIDGVREAGSQAEVAIVVSDDAGALSRWTFSLSKQETAGCEGCWMTDGVVQSRP